MKTYDLSGINVVLADPNPFMREIMREILDGLGVIRVTMVPDTRDLLKLLQNPDGIDMIFMEVDFDGEDALPVIEQIRNNPERQVAFMPIVVVAGDASIRRITQARDLGATEFLAKPVAAISVYRRLIQVIEKPRPFVKIEDLYFGPDRRRQIKEFSGGERRTDALPEIAASAAV